MYKKSDNLDHRSFAFPVNAAFFNSLFVAVNHMIAMRAVKWSPMKTNISAFMYPGRCVYHTGVSKKIAPAIQYLLADSLYIELIFFNLNGIVGIEPLDTSSF